MFSFTIRFCLLMVFGLPLWAQDASNDFQPGSHPISVISGAQEHDGIAVDVTLHQADLKNVSKPIQEGDMVRFTFKMTDKATGQGLSKAAPAGWLVARGEQDNLDPDICMKKAKTLISGSVFSKAELDLNVYFVVTLNDDATLSVVDPLFGFGSSKLLTLVQLEGRGYDWALAPDQEHIYVSVPDAGKLMRVNTQTWAVQGSLAVGPQPSRTVIQPDGQYLWVANEDGERSGVTAVSCSDFKIVKHIPTGKGKHDLVLSPDSRTLWVSNGDADSVSVIDTQTLALVKQLPTGERPISIAYSSKADAAYVSHEGSGTVVAIDGKRHVQVATMPLKPGLGQISFAPDGFKGFVLNPEQNTFHVLDVATNRIVQTGDMEAQPDQIAYSDQLAYIRQRGSGTVWMVPLAVTGEEGRALSVVDFPAGQNPPGQMTWPTPAQGMVLASGSTSMLIANPLDQAIYYYKEGMAAPMGNFSNYGRQPRAVLVVDRSLREKSPGIYQTYANVPAAGSYDLVLFMDSPRLVMCFPVKIEADPNLKPPLGAEVKILSGALAQVPRLNEPVELSFQVLEKGQPLAQLEDVSVMVYLTPGVWHNRGAATNHGNGAYTYRFTPPQAGFYYASLAIPSKGIGYNNAQYAVVQVPPADAPKVVEKQ